MFYEGVIGFGNAIGVPPEELKKGILAPLCLKELINPMKVAEHALFLCTDAAKYQTGSVSYNDCGYTL